MARTIGSALRSDKRLVSPRDILEARAPSCTPMVKNRFVVEVGDTAALKSCISKLRNVESVFDAYRVTPSG